MNILIIIFSLTLLITLHEFGHFIFAKKFGVKVEEFGIGLPPRLLGKKIGDTIYSINLLPLGGFVKLLGQDEQVKSEESFSEKSILQRAIILVAGVVSFWIIAILIFATVSGFWGIYEFSPDNEETDEAFLFVNYVDPESSLYSELKMHDRIIAIDGILINKISELRNNLTEKEAVTAIIERGPNQFEVNFLGITDESERFVNGVHVLRVKKIQFGLFESLKFGTQRTIDVTYMQMSGIGMLLKGLVLGGGMPEGMEVGGPVMIGSLAVDALTVGWPEYLMFVGMIATVLAFMNILPIPALDGGRLLFLLIEKIKGSPISEKVEQTLNAAFFILLITLMVAVTVRDIYNIF